MRQSGIGYRASVNLPKSPFYIMDADCALNILVITSLAVILAVASVILVYFKKLKGKTVIHHSTG